MGCSCQELYDPPFPDAYVIEATDARADRHPPAEPQPPSPEAESGRGLLLVAALSDRWGTEPGPAPCKTIWAEIGTAPPTPHS